MTKREVYLPKGMEWTQLNDGRIYQGGQKIVVDTPLDIIPVFVKNGNMNKIFEDALSLLI